MCSANSTKKEEEAGGDRWREEAGWVRTGEAGARKEDGRETQTRKSEKRGGKKQTLDFPTGKKKK